MEHFTVFDPSDPLAELARIRVRKAAEDPGSFEGAVQEVLHRSLEENPTSWSESTRKVMQGVVEGVKDQKDAQAKIRQASETAVLTVARCWGNVVSAGKATVLATREAASRNGMDSEAAARQASLGAMEGVRRVGPVAYPLLRRELRPMVEDFDEAWDAEVNKERTFHSEELPVIVPMEAGKPQEPKPRLTFWQRLLRFFGGR